MRLALGLILLAAIALPFAFAQSKPKPLFDGRSFAGWEGDRQIFRIEGGAIVGGSLAAALPKNQFLCTTAEYGDFELRVKFRLLGDPAKANAGVQFRSRRIPNDHEVIGYQADVGQQYWGALYDESRRRKVLAGPSAADLDRIVRRGEWNDYVIRAEGARIRLTLNGVQTVDYTEPDSTIEKTGCICLQIHSGPASEAWYKEITIEPLAPRR